MKLFIIWNFSLFQGFSNVDSPFSVFFEVDMEEHFKGRLWECKDKVSRKKWIKGGKNQWEPKLDEIENILISFELPKDFINIRRGYIHE